MTDVNLERLLARKLIGDSRKMQQLRTIIKFAGRCNSSIMITGPSGSGKEVVAEAIHAISDRGTAPHIAVNCGALAEQLIESELFGHEKGSFTGAVNQHVGLFEQANNGTIFLDEIGDMPVNMQVKLLRVLETRVVNRVGGNRNIGVDVRVIAATHKHLGECIKSKSFREDLYYRLCVVPIEVPALNERVEDIPALIAHFLKHQDGANPLPIFSAEALVALQRYSWPGNVRELRNVVERASVFFSGQQILVGDVATLLQSDFAQAISDIDATASTSKELSPTDRTVPFPAAQSAPNFAHQEDTVRDLNVHLQFEERRIIMKALDTSHGVVARAARSINIKRTTLIDKMRKHNIDWRVEDRVDYQIAV
ncbi:sigma-54 interaction domain-containing protein [Parasphingorhabdus halotolerans]|uniref:Sigma-54-dependent Fis family transcriptional regulator n=1 Tax=Parasphingorhabdus halotolerans TaxID=2725558 RepID=A0A6H2DH84_9SPHN|nr:sigma-54 dependent transcriptional regulator [Parasphingorhabdus halotolerans]QJB68032.1 sigma-54-dependent Fis family transcriptional regulator [Parasphingorhabdus halotolerans]